MSLRSSALRGLQHYLDLASSNISDSQTFDRCFNYTAVTHIMSTYFATNILLIYPLYFSVLHLGFQQWKKCCFPSSAPATRQSDLFTYNMAAMGLIEILACGLYSVGTYTSAFAVAEFGLIMYYVCWFVKLSFQTLTCVEHYLAVVHPVMYLGLKKKAGSRIRSTIIAWTWIFLLLWEALAQFMSDLFNMITFGSYLAFSFIVMFFCCVSVLWALKRPGPGQAICDREHINQTKRRAFRVVLTILSAVLLTLVWVVVCNALHTSQLLHLRDKCLMMVFVLWFSLPCNLVLPILHLQRAGKLPRCSHNSQSGECHGKSTKIGVRKLTK